MFDFNNALSHRIITRSAEEDMALAWREVYGGLPCPYVRVPVSDHLSPIEVAAAFKAPAHPPEPGGQAVLFDTPETSFEEAEEVGYRGPTACSAAGITYRQLDYWARTGLVEPSIRGGHRSQRLYGFRDILLLKVVKRLLDTGISLQQIRAAVHHLRDRGTSDLAEVTLMSDGLSVYECTSPDEVVDLLQGGHGVFGIALGRVWVEVEGSLAELPVVRAEAGLLTKAVAPERESKPSERAG